MTVQQTTEYLDTLNLVNALWWFIENVNEDTPGRSEIFFHLRNRVRCHQDDPKAENWFAKQLIKAGLNTPT